MDSGADWRVHTDGLGRALHAVFQRQARLTTRTSRPRRALRLGWPDAAGLDAVCAQHTQRRPQPDGGRTDRGGKRKGIFVNDDDFVQSERELPVRILVHPGVSDPHRSCLEPLKAYSSHHEPHRRRLRLVNTSKRHSAMASATAGCRESAIRLDEPHKLRKQTAECDARGFAWETRERVSFTR